MKKLLAIILLVIISFTPIKAGDVSIMAEYANPTFNSEITRNGIFDFEVDTEFREYVNSEIAKGTETRYSLYDRFGGNIWFVAYGGESSMDITLIDHLYTSLATGQELEISDIFYSSTEFLGTIAYKGRAPVLTQDLLKEGFIDPRVTQYNIPGTILTFSRANFGNTFLFTSKAMVRVIGILAGNLLYTTFFNVVEAVQLSEIWSNIIAPVIYFFIMVGLLVFVLRSISYIKQMLTGDNTKSITKFGINVARTIGIFALLYFMASHPTWLNEPMKFITTTINDAFSSALILTEEDDVIYSSSTENVIEASLWKVTVFEPWCKGMFGKEYKYLYTQYADVEDEYKLEQSFDNSHTVNEEGLKTTDSAGMTGDVFVSVGEDKIRNWAAYAWSTQSAYHIDYTQQDTVMEGERIFWPVAQRMPNNANIYRDSFRWLDAKLNISPQYGENTVIGNYVDSVEYTEDFVVQGIDSLIRAVPLVFFIPPLLLKLKSFIFLIGITFTLVARAIYSLLVNEKDRTTNTLWDDLQDNFWHYIIAIIKVYVLTAIYPLMIGKGLIPYLLFILFAYSIVSWDKDIIGVVESAKKVAKQLGTFVKKTKKTFSS